jgi:hypothetical protein
MPPITERGMLRKRVEAWPTDTAARAIILDLLGLLELYSEERRLRSQMCRVPRNQPDLYRDIRADHESVVRRIDALEMAPE